MSSRGDGGAAASLLESVTLGEVTYERWEARPPLKITAGYSVLGDLEIAGFSEGYNGSEAGHTFYRTYGYDEEKFQKFIDGDQFTTLVRRQGDAIIAGNAGGYSLSEGTTQRDLSWWNGYEQGRIDGMTGKDRR